MRQHKLNLYMLMAMLILSACVAQRPQFNSSEFQNFITKGMTYLEQYDEGSVISLKRAKANFELAEQLNDLSPLTYDGLGSVAYRENDINKASYYFNLAIEKDPNYGRAYSNLAYIAYQENKIKEAEVLLKKSIELNKFDAHAINNLGSLIFNQNSTKSSKDQAKELFVKARELYSGRLKLIDHNIEIVEK